MALILASDECSSKSLDDDIPNVIGRILVHLIFRNEPKRRTRNIIWMSFACI